MQTHLAKMLALLKNLFTRSKNMLALPRSMLARLENLFTLFSCMHA